DKQANARARHRADLAVLRKIPGVESVAAVDALPFNGNNWINGIKKLPETRSYVLASAFLGSPGEIETLGLKLVAGRDFTPDEYVPLLDAHGQQAGLQHASAVIVTRALAERLFPHENPLGKSIYSYPNPMRIVGVVQ